MPLSAALGDEIKQQNALLNMKRTFLDQSTKDRMAGESRALDAWKDRYSVPVRVPMPQSSASSSWTPLDEEEQRLHRVVFAESAVAEEELQLWQQCEQGAAEISALAEMLVQLVHSDAQKLDYAVRKNELTADAFERGHESLAEAQRRRVKAWARNAGWTGAGVGIGLGLLIAGPVGIAVGGVGAWLVGGAAVGGSVLGATSGLTARAFEKKSLRTIDDAVRKVHEQRLRVSADARALDAKHTPMRESVAAGADARRAAEAWLDNSPQGRTAKSLSDAADMAYAVHEQLCTDYRTILQNKQLVHFHEYVEQMSDELLAVGLFRPAARVRASPATLRDAQLLDKQWLLAEMAHPPHARAAPDPTAAPDALKAHISALLTELTLVHRGVGRILEGQLGELDAVLDATTECTVKAAGLVKRIVQLQV